VFEILANSIGYGIGGIIAFNVRTVLGFVLAVCRRGDLVDWEDESKIQKTRL
ncbi:MAG: hypothetical protein FD163_2567, partial [Hyphomonadaceae bacterium]